jgi:hypothetical protein
LALEARIAARPERVPIKAVLAEEDIVKLAPEAKQLTDTIKMVACRAETALVRCLAPHYAKTADEGPALIARCCRRVPTSSRSSTLGACGSARMRYQPAPQPRPRPCVCDAQCP